jgi:S-adenosylhomocysteine hydrolase
MVFTYEGYSSLPLIQYLADSIPKNLLKDVYLIACQHVLPSAHLMIRSMMDLGLATENIAVIGKCYSTSALAAKNLQKEGIYVCPSSSVFDSHQSFDAQFRDNIEKFLINQILRMNITEDSKIIILDDGGELIYAAHRLLSGYRYIYGVEQTSSGYYKLKNTKLHFPVVNVARSKAKLSIESPMIVESIIRQIDNSLNRLSLVPKSCLIIGNGAIGKCLYEKLKTQYDLIKCYDIDKDKSDLVEPIIKEYDLIIGTTGQNVLENQNQLRAGQILASVSSSDREFNAVTHRKHLPHTNNCHMDLLVNDIWILNSGFPINFHGTDYDNVPLKYIQLTFALLFAGVSYVIQNSSNLGLIQLPESIQNNIITRFLNNCYEYNQEREVS